MLISERIVSFSEAAEHLPRFKGKKVSSAAVWRWARKGVRGVHLESILLGGRFVTSVEAIERFGRALEETTRLPEDSAPAIPRRRGRPPRRRAQEIEAAKADLERAGI